MEEITADLFKYYGIDWLGTFFGLFSMYLIGKKRRFGFLTAVISDSFWMTFAWLTHSYAVCFACTVAIILSFKGYHYWGKDEKKELVLEVVTANDDDSKRSVSE